MPNTLSPLQIKDASSGGNLPSLYADFDSKMLALIKASPMTAAALTKALDLDSKPFTNRPKDEFRVIDRRLQALRKKGLIAWERRGAFVVWKPTE